MRKTFLFFVLCLLSVLSLQAATVYTKISGVPTEGWPGTYIIVYEKSATQALVWDGTTDDNNFKTVTLTDGTITSENLTDCHITVTKESASTYYVKTSEGRIRCAAKQDGLIIDNNGSECTIQSSGTYTILETNNKTCRFLCNAKSETSFRFRFFYDQNKTWSNTQRKNICFYALGEVSQEAPGKVLDINYAQADLYACPSKFPTQSNPYFQYFYTNLRLLQCESEEAVPYVDLEIYAPTQYSITGEYKSDKVSNVTAGTDLRFWINCQAGSKHSAIKFPSKEGGTWGSINAATMTITDKGKSSQPNARRYHFKLTLTDSNKVIWSLDKELDVFAQWIDCDRSKDKETDMDPVAFELESESHGTTGLEKVQKDNVQGTKFIKDGQLYLMYEGHTYNMQGQEIQL